MRDARSSIRSSTPSSSGIPRRSSRSARATTDPASPPWASRARRTWRCRSAPPIPAHFSERRNRACHLRVMCWRGSARAAGSSPSPMSSRPGSRSRASRAGIRATRSKAEQAWRHRTPPASPPVSYRRWHRRADVPWLSVDDSVDAAPRATQIPVTYKRSALTTPGVYVGTVTAINPRDVVAGPLFTLVNTVIVPMDLSAKPVFDERRAVAPGSVQRYFLRVPQDDATLRATVTLPDSQSQQATVRLYEPNGEPARSAPEDIEIGQQESGSAVITVRAEDMVAGVYELDVIAPPLTRATATVRAELGPVALAPAQHGSLEASSVLAGAAQASTTTGDIAHRLVGAERRYAIAGRGQPAESLHLRPPRSAKPMEGALTPPPALWG